MSDENGNQGDDLPQQTAQELLAAEREHLLKECGIALEVEDWGNHPLTVAFGESIEQQLASEEAAIHEALDSADKPVSTAQQLAYRGRRSALEGVLKRVKDARAATITALEKAQKFEANEERESGLHYRPPAWDDYLVEARKRTGRDPGAPAPAPSAGASGDGGEAAAPRRKSRRKVDPAPAEAVA